jgi:hypothetical protein
MQLSEILTELKKERDGLNQVIAALEGVKGKSFRGKSSGKRTISKAGRARIAAAQRARWAAFKTKRKKH